MEDKQARALTTATPMNAAELLVRCLENEGVRYVFGVPGEEILDLLDALSRSSTNSLLTRHEQGAAFMADVYGRLSTYPGVCLATLGPGATNLITGIADAKLDARPWWRSPDRQGWSGCTRSRTSTSTWCRCCARSPSGTREWSSWKPCPRWCVKHSGWLAWKSRALRTLNCPKTWRRCDVPPTLQPDAHSPHHLPAGGTCYAGEGGRSALRAKRPLVLAGNGVVRRAGQRARAADAAGRAIRQLNIPVAHTYMGKGCIDYRDPHALRHRWVAEAGRRPGRRVPELADADLVDDRRIRPGGVVARAVEPARRQRDYTRGQHARRDRRPLSAALVEVVGEIGVTRCRRWRRYARHAPTLVGRRQAARAHRRRKAR